MAEVTVLVCDWCSKPGAVRYHIRSEEDGEWDVDLCAKCSAKMRPEGTPPARGNKFTVTRLPPQPTP